MSMKLGKDALRSGVSSPNFVADFSNATNESRERDSTAHANTPNYGLFSQQGNSINRGGLSDLEVVLLTPLHLPTHFPLMTRRSSGNFPRIGSRR